MPWTTTWSAWPNPSLPPALAWGLHPLTEKTLGLVSLATGPRGFCKIQWPEAACTCVPQCLCISSSLCPDVLLRQHAPHPCWGAGLSSSAGLSLASPSWGAFPSRSGAARCHPGPVWSLCFPLASPLSFCPSLGQAWSASPLGPAAQPRAWHSLSSHAPHPFVPQMSVLRAYMSGAV